MLKLMKDSCNTLERFITILYVFFFVSFFGTLTLIFFLFLFATLKQTHTHTLSHLFFFFIFDIWVVYRYLCSYAFFSTKSGRKKRNHVKPCIHHNNNRIKNLFFFITLQRTFRYSKKKLYITTCNLTTSQFISITFVMLPG